MNTLDDNEQLLSNANSALSKRRQLRRDAMLLGASGSPVDPGIHFLRCSDCAVSLASHNHGCGLLCDTCFADEQVIVRYRVARQAYLDAADRAAMDKASKAFWPAMGWATLWVAGACGAALALAWAVDKVAWWIGGGP